jgi:basic membrane lipoprotein Med (substrate-binding protein (PBP1-ABC) superfamily)
VAEIPEAFLTIAREVRGGRFHPRMIEYGMRDGMVRLVYNPKLIKRIPPAAMAPATDAERAIASGQFSIEPILTGPDSK